MKLGTKVIENVLMVVILVIILFTVLADTAPDVQTAASSIANESDVYPLTSFFKEKGILLLAFMAGIVIVLIKSFFGGGSK